MEVSVFRESFVQQEAARRKGGLKPFPSAISFNMAMYCLQGCAGLSEKLLLSQWMIIETVVLLNNLNSKEKNHVSVDVDMDEYRRIKDR